MQCNAKKMYCKKCNAKIMRFSMTKIRIKEYINLNSHIASMLHVTSYIWNKISQFWDHSWRVLCSYQPRFRTELIMYVNIKMKRGKRFYWPFTCQLSHFNIGHFIILYTARIGYTFSCHYPTLLNSLRHCICVHQGKISAAAAPQGSESTTLPMSYPGASIYSYFWRNKLVIYNFIALVPLSQHLPTFSF